MKPILLRSSEFEVVGDGRTIEGIAFQWDRPSLVSDPGVPRYLEEFAQRSADQTIRQRAIRPLFVRHIHVRGSVGETVFTKSAEGLMFRARTSDTTFAGETLERVNAGELPAVSVGFRPIKTLKRSDPRGTVTVRTEIAIAELSLCEEGDHDGAKVLSVRSADVAGTPWLDELRKQRVLLAL